LHYEKWIAISCVKMKGRSAIIDLCPQHGKISAYTDIGSKVIRSVNAALFARACTCGSGGRNRRVKER
jgi:hypothetical protein